MIKRLILLATASTFTFGLAAPESETVFPITEEPLTLDYWVPMNPNALVVLDSYADMTAYQELARLSNITFNFIHPPSEGVDQALNLMIVSGNLPDILETTWSSTGTLPPAKALADGIIVPLNDLIAEHAPNLQAILEANPEIRREISTADGTIYAFPFLRMNESQRIFYGPIIRQDWLDNLGLEMPTDIESWQTVLTAFKTQDPNGNGQADEIPYSLTPDIGTLMQGFGSAFGLLPGFYQVDGVVKHSALEPAYLEFLTTMRDWYQEGLIDPDYLVNDADTFDGKVLGDQVGATAGYANSTALRLTELATNVPDFSLVGAPFPEDASGTSYNFISDARNIYNGSGVAITAANESPVETAKLLDYGYTKEGSRLLYFGPDGFQLVDGVATWTEEVENDPELSFTQATTRHGRGAFNAPIAVRDEYININVLTPERAAISVPWRAASAERILPPLSPAPEDVQTYASIMSEVDTYIDEMTANFISGREPLENFESFQSTLEGQGLTEALAIMQNALDTYEAK